MNENPTENNSQELEQKLINIQENASHSSPASPKNKNNQEKKISNKKIIGDYLIKETIGKGTFSRVKLGIHMKTGKKVAIKILDKSKIVEKEDLERIIREMEILSEMSHPNIIKVYQIFENSQNYYIIMEYCEGGELFNYIVEKQRLDEEEASFFYYQLINGLEYLHNKGIAHRDLKPENLLLCQNKQIKIIDFGLSNFFDGHTNLVTPCGSPCYASPEMVSGETYDGFMIDVWATGIILFAMLCGYLPFEDEKDDENDNEESDDSEEESDNEVLFNKIMEGKLDYPDYLSVVAVDLMKRILVTDPKKRITIDGIKKHKFYLKGKKVFKRYNKAMETNELSEKSLLRNKFMKEFLDGDNENENKEKNENVNKNEKNNKVENNNNNNKAENKNEINVEINNNKAENINENNIKVENNNESNNKVENINENNDEYKNKFENNNKNINENNNVNININNNENKNKNKNKPEDNVENNNNNTDQDSNKDNTNNGYMITENNEEFEDNKNKIYKNSVESADNKKDTINKDVNNENINKENIEIKNSKEKDNIKPNIEKNKIPINQKQNLLEMENTNKNTPKSTTTNYTYFSISPNINITKIISKNSGSPKIEKCKLNENIFRQNKSISTNANSNNHSNVLKTYENMEEYQKKLFMNYLSSEAANRKNNKIVKINNQNINKNQNNSPITKYSNILPKENSNTTTINQKTNNNSKIENNNIPENTYLNKKINKNGINKKNFTLNEIVLDFNPYVSNSNQKLGTTATLCDYYINQSKQSRSLGKNNNNAALYKNSMNHYFRSKIAKLKPISYKNTNYFLDSNNNISSTITINNNNSFTKEKNKNLGSNILTIPEVSSSNKRTTTHDNYGKNSKIISSNNNNNNNNNNKYLNFFAKKDSYKYVTEGNVSLNIFNHSNMINNTTSKKPNAISIKKPILPLIKLNNCSGKKFTQTNSNNESKSISPLLHLRTESNNNDEKTKGHFFPSYNGSGVNLNGFNGTSNKDYFKYRILNDLRRYRIPLYTGVGLSN